MADILSMGELLIDFTPSGTGPDGQMLFARNPGGAPANVAVQARRAGVSAGFLGCVGDDMFGRFLFDTLKECGVDVTGLALDGEYATSLAFVQLNEQGDRDFSFYRAPGADTRLDAGKVDKKLIDDCRVLCFGSLLLTAEPARSSVSSLVDYARVQGKITAYDPNWRPPLWASRDKGVAAMGSLLGKADIVKVSEEELALLSGKTDMETGAAELLGQGVRLVVVTLGAKGCAAYTPGFALHRNTYDTQVRDTTGSGDSFFGALLSKIVLSGCRPDDISKEALSDILDFANAAGAVCATKMGAIPAIPYTDDIELCQRTTPFLVI